VNGLQLIIGCLIAVAIAAVGYFMGSLSKSGAMSAVVVGAVTFGFGGFLPAVLLVTFFVSSSALSRVGGFRKREVAEAFAKGGNRDAGQVFANGGLAALLASLFGVTENGIWLVGLAGALAAVNADTWSTELGVLASGWPRLITNGSRVEPGTSGGVTLEGTLAALGGAMAIAILAGIGSGELQLGIAVVIGGFCGAILDSLLGASVQAIYFCPSCNKQTERHPYHSCNSFTNHVRGWKWLSNDGVNFIASVIGTAVAISLWYLI
jgi:uncharacterized protein (TIGR00297 family)